MLIKMPALSFGGVKKFATSQAGPLYSSPPLPLSLAVHLHILTARVGSTVCLDGQQQLKCFYFPLRFFFVFSALLCFLCCPRIVPVALALRRQMDENVKPNCGQFSGAGERGGNKQ